MLCILFNFFLRNLNCFELNNFLITNQNISKKSFLFTFIFDFILINFTNLLSFIILANIFYLFINLILNLIIKSL